MIFKYPLQKIVVSTGLGRLSQNAEFEKKQLPEVSAALAQITGQKAQPRPAKKSIAGFKLREGIIIGLKTTLRRERMMQFLNKTVHAVLPRIRDFHGITLTSIDERGNLTFGIKEHIVFPEIVLEDVNTIFGIEITLVPRKPLSKEEAVSLYRQLGIPLEKETANAEK
ncbi:MAG: 50S ribosomal protein L5 [Candidatus Harrisonbacteria bacterium]|nr:50S ribosomal protein L5 [Candidatus Harrisonbacteria bacterium]